MTRHQEPSAQQELDEPPQLDPPELDEPPQLDPPELPEQLDPVEQANPPPLSPPPPELPPPHHTTGAPAPPSVCGVVRGPEGPRRGPAAPRISWARSSGSGTASGPFSATATRGSVLAP
ncbi:hypothetical protein [Streptomyces venezuelae]|uniref:hypothetical protein n=1 Tax=Streptomyces venezuelae TaxID=54571 RepID=UPI001CC2264B|nr:hypothetical protein [Streptomyces venezuelae]